MISALSEQRQAALSHSGTAAEQSLIHILMCLDCRELDSSDVSSGRSSGSFVKPV